jgi:kinesin family protein 2/24
MDKALTFDGKTEIYITISDLAGNSAFDLLDSRKPFSVLQDSSGVTHLAGAKEYRVEAIDQVLELLDEAACFRRTESTKKNDASSRSHSICRIRVKNASAPNASAEEGILYLVDLAGSEAARDVAEHGADRVRETREINISLSVLKDCLRGKAEVEIARREGREKKVHVPIRRSTLTRVLKHVFDPKESRPCKTVLIACVNPSLADVGPSKNTLRYAEMLGDIGV